ncbi:MAG: aldo/keto reductase [Actinomycetota bacterium]|nr:aldo/keto reductase [Actinomycetota bacterium]
MNGSPASERVLDDTSVGTVTIGGDLTVRRLGFGSMRISGARNAEGARDRDEARRLIRQVVDRGVNFIDTANIYGYGESEEIIAEALHPYPAGLVITTKAGFKPGKIMKGHATLPPSGHPDHIIAECEGSLRRLRVDVIDLYQMHVPDPNYPYDETLGAFVQLQQQGKIRHIGISNVSLAQLDFAQSLLTVASVENRYNAADRDADLVLAACRERGIAFIPWAPIILNTDRVSGAVAAIAAAHGAGGQQVALQWLLQRSPNMVPIPGTSQITHANENIDAAWLQLSDDDLAAIDAAAGVGPA